MCTEKNIEERLFFFALIKYLRWNTKSWGRSLSSVPPIFFLPAKMRGWTIPQGIGKKCWPLKNVLALLIAPSERPCYFLKCLASFHSSSKWTLSNESGEEVGSCSTLTSTNGSITFCLETWSRTIWKARSSTGLPSCTGILKMVWRTLRSYKSSKKTITHWSGTWLWLTSCPTWGWVGGSIRVVRAFRNVIHNEL